MPGFPVHHQLLELAQTHVHRVSDAIQPCPIQNKKLKEKHSIVLKYFKTNPQSLVMYTKSLQMLWIFFKIICEKSKYLKEQMI